MAIAKHVSFFVTYGSGARFKEHCFNISWDIHDWVLYSTVLVEQPMTEGLARNTYGSHIMLQVDGTRLR